MQPRDDNRYWGGMPMTTPMMPMQHGSDLQSFIQRLSLIPVTPLGGQVAATEDQVGNLLELLQRWYLARLNFVNNMVHYTATHPHSPILTELGVNNLLQGLLVDPDQNVRTNATAALFRIRTTPPLMIPYPDPDVHHIRNVIHSYHQAQLVFSQLALNATQHIPILYHGPANVESREALSQWLGQLLQPLAADNHPQVANNARLAMANLTNTNQESRSPYVSNRPSPVIGTSRHGRKRNVVSYDESHDWDPPSPPSRRRKRHGSGEHQRVGYDNVKKAPPNGCSECGVRDSPEWRRGPSGEKDLCNACGLRWNRLKRITGLENPPFPPKEDGRRAEKAALGAATDEGILASESAAAGDEKVIEDEDEGEKDEGEKDEPEKVEEDEVQVETDKVEEDEVQVETEKAQDETPEEPKSPKDSENVE